MTKLKVIRRPLFMDSHTLINNIPSEEVKQHENKLGCTSIHSSPSNSLVQVPCMITLTVIIIILGMYLAFWLDKISFRNNNTFTRAVHLDDSKLQATYQKSIGSVTKTISNLTYPDMY